MLTPATAISLLVLASLIIGLARDLVVAYYFGTDWHADLYFLALIIPLFIENSFAISLRDALVPALLRRKEKGAAAFRDLLGQVAGLLLLLALAVWLLFALTSDVWIRLLDDTHLALLHGNALRQAYQFGIAMIPLALWFYFLTGISHAERAFVLPAWRGVVFNATGIVALLLVSRSTEVLLAGMVVGMLLHLLLLQVAVGRVPLRWPGRLADAAGTQLLRRFLTLLVVALLLQAVIGAERLLASFTGEGGLARLSYAFRIVTVPLVVFTFGVMGMAYARFSTAVARADEPHLAQAFLDTARVCLFLLLPTAVAMVVFAHDVLALLLFRGAFTDQDMAQTSAVMQIYAVGLPAMGMAVVLARMLVVLDRFRPLLAVTGLSMAVTSLGYLVVYRPYGIAGLASVTVGGTVLQCALQWLALPARYRRLPGTRDLLASGLTVVLLALALPWLPPLGLAGLMVGGGVVLALPALLQWIFLRTEFTGSLSRALGRQGR